LLDQQLTPIRRFQVSPKSTSKCLFLAMSQSLWTAVEPVDGSSSNYKIISRFMFTQLMALIKINRCSCEADAVGCSQNVFRLRYLLLCICFYSVEKLTMSKTHEENPRNRPSWDYNWGILTALDCFGFVIMEAKFNLPQLIYHTNVFWPNSQL
jgi:hypothetical protein